MNPVVHFEMPYDDRDRMAAFYEQAFGWKTHKFGPDMGNYVVAHTTETDEENMVKEPGRINGGFSARGDGNQFPSIVIQVNDIRAAMQKVREAGGRIVGGHAEEGEPDEIPGIGLYIGYVDTEGNRGSLLQPKGE